MKKSRLSSLDKGHDLEIKMEKYFQINGYKTKRNLILEGISGSRHEIDVLAEKLDDVTSIKIMVECKAWNKPIEKDTVSKVSYVLKDLGLNKAIIVTFKGYTTGAEKAAKVLSVELWGSSEIEKKLGKVAVAEIDTKEFEKTSMGFDTIIKEENAKSIILKEITGVFGGRSEIIKKFNLIWIPCYLFQIGCTKSEGTFRIKLTTKPVWNLYDALDGFHLHTFEERPILRHIKIGKSLQPRIKDRNISSQMTKYLEKALQLVTTSSKQRYYKKLEQMGLPVWRLNNISIDSVDDAYYPFFIAILEGQGKERILAVDAVIGKINKMMSSALTRNFSYALQTLK